jgi:hypothetical protein
LLITHTHTHTYIGSVFLLLTNRDFRTENFKISTHTHTHTHTPLQYAEVSCVAYTLHNGSRGTALLFLHPRSQMKVGGQRHAQAALPPRKETRYPMYRRLGGVQGQAGLVRKISLPLEFDPRAPAPPPD